MADEPRADEPQNPGNPPAASEVPPDPYDVKPVEPQPAPEMPKYSGARLSSLSSAPQTPAEPPTEEQLDIEKHKAVAMAGYLIFLVPLLVAPQSKFARYHANQGLILFIASAAVYIILLIGSGIFGVVEHFVTSSNDIVKGVLWIGNCLCALLYIAIGVSWLLMAIAGIINAANGELKPLPGIGMYRMIK